jgi:hypothetical protein
MLRRILARSISAGQTDGSRGAVGVEPATFAVGAGAVAANATVVAAAAAAAAAAVEPSSEGSSRWVEETLGQHTSEV